MSLHTIISCPGSTFHISNLEVESSRSQPSSKIWSKIFFASTVCDINKGTGCVSLPEGRWIQIKESWGNKTNNWKRVCNIVQLRDDHYRKGCSKRANIKVCLRFVKGEVEGEQSSQGGTERFLELWHFATFTNKNFIGSTRTLTALSLDVEQNTSLAWTSGSFTLSSYYLLC